VVCTGLRRGASSSADAARWIDEHGGEYSAVPKGDLIRGVCEWFQLKQNSVRAVLRRLSDNNGVHGNSTLTDDDITMIGGMCRAFAQVGTPLSASMLQPLCRLVTGKTVHKATAYRLTERYPDVFGTHTTTGSSKKRKSMALARVSVEQYRVAVEKVVENCHYSRHAVIAYDGFAFWHSKGTQRMQRGRFELTQPRFAMLQARRRM
jgi:hypothetical protein